MLDSLRYWVEEMRVDGFRFDIAPVLARADPAFDPAAPFFERVRRDPLLAGVKLIAEPWDLGPDGYQLGRFPAGWAEWNGKFRDGVRRFWRGTGERLASWPHGSPGAAISSRPAIGGRSRASTSSPATTDSRCTTW